MTWTTKAPERDGLYFWRSTLEVGAGELQHGIERRLQGNYQRFLMSGWVMGEVRARMEWWDERIAVPSENVIGEPILTSFGHGSVTSVEWMASGEVRRHVALDTGGEIVLKEKH